MTEELYTASFSTELGDIGRLREIASAFFPEESRSLASNFTPDDIDLSSVYQSFKELQAGSGISFEKFYFPEQQPTAYQQNGTISEIYNNSLTAEREIFDVQTIRRDFPILHQKVNGKQLVWFDNAATTQKPQVVIDEIARFYANDNSNIHRAAHTLAARSTDQYEGARSKVQRFINASSSEEIIFVRGTTEGINLITQTYGEKYIQEGDEIIISTLDHHANIVPWQQLAKKKNAKLLAIPIDNNGNIILEDYERLLSPRTKVVSIGHVNNTFGTIVPVKTIIGMELTAR